MKKIFLILCTLIFSLGTYAQEWVIKSYNSVPNTPLPFEHTRANKSSSRYGFPYGLWGDKVLNDTVCNDIGLTVPQPPELDDWTDCTLNRTFTPTNGNYKLCVVSIGTFDYGKTMLISINNSGNYIDAIEVDAALAIAPKGDFIYPEQFRIDSNMQVTVYQLKPTSATPLIFNGAITFPLNARRIDRVYQIDSTGHFSLIRTTNYLPQNYTLNQFSSPDYNIWQGNETPQ